ncbi:MAG TPA: hypothetical protein PKM58_11200, partial [Pyrinomonadaceae bacterium]|nr:hypothetical protein [Pyrinomonadaceae bacterium]
MPAAATTDPKIFNISELARGFNLDRATVRKRIDAAGIVPVDQKAKETRFLLDEKLEEILLAADADLDAEKLRKLKAEANLKEMEVQVRRGELAPVRDFQETVQALFGGLYKEIAVRFPKKVGSRMARAKTAAAASAVLARELDQIFLSVRADFTKHLDNGEPAAKGRTKKQ